MSAERLNAADEAQARGQMDIEPIKSTRIYEEIVRQVKQLIAEGKLKSGDRLPPERDLAEKFMVSRTSVRERAPSSAPSRWTLSSSLLPWSSCPTAKSWASCSRRGACWNPPSPLWPRDGRRGTS